MFYLQMRNRVISTDIQAAYKTAIFSTRILS
jgi:hypothetical protein